MQYWDPHPNKPALYYAVEKLFYTVKRNNKWKGHNFTIFGNALLYTVLSLTVLCLWIEKIIFFKLHQVHSFYPKYKFHGGCTWWNFQFIHTFPFKYRTSRNVNKDLILALLVRFFNSLTLCIADNRSYMDIMFFIISLSKIAKIMSR